VVNTKKCIAWCLFLKTAHIQMIGFTLIANRQLFGDNCKHDTHIRT
jgi:hypothetical protein